MDFTKSFSEKFKLTKPGIAVLLDLVAVSSFVMGLDNLALIWKILPLISAGTLASFSSSLLNNYFDRDIDGKMKRTEWRTKYSDSVFYAISVTGLLVISMVISMAFLNLPTTIWILLGFLSYSIFYTMVLKRNTKWNIVIGGIAGSFPALAGWSSVNSIISYPSLFLAVIVFLWTPTHFWSLALKYKKEYLAAGIPMMPSLVSANRAAQLIIVSTIVLVVFSFLPLFLNMGFPLSYKLIIIPVSTYLFYRVILLLPSKKRDVIKTSLKAFLASNYYLMVILIAIVFGRVLSFI